MTTHDLRLTDVAVERAQTGTGERLHQTDWLTDVVGKPAEAERLVGMF
jgi:hypothetical protein